MWIIVLVVLTVLSAVPVAQSATCNCSSLSTFNTCVNNAACGDEVVLAAGTYTGFSATINKNCPTGNRITIRGANSTGTILSGNSTKLLLQGNGINIKWFNITNKNSGGLDGGVQFMGARFYRFTENTFKNSNGLSTAMVIGNFSTRDSEDIEIDNNTFSDMLVAYVLRIYAADGGGESGGHSKRINVHHNIFRDLLDKSETGQSDSMFEMGRSGGASGHLAIDTTYENNLFLRISGNWGTFHPKVSNVFIRHNTFIDTFGFIFRHGANHQYTDNYFEATSGYIPKVGNGGVFNVNNVGSTIARNVVKCASSQCKYIVACSFGTGDSTPGDPQHYETCKDLVVEDNTFHNSNQSVIHLGTDRGSSSNNGPRLDPPHDIIVRRNHIVSNDGTLLSKHAEVTQNITIQDNHFYPSTSQATNDLLGTGSSSGDPAYISTTAGATGAFQPTLSAALDRGAMRRPTIDSCLVDSTAVNTNKITWLSSFPPVVGVTTTNLDTSVNAGLRTTTGIGQGAPLRTDAAFDGAAVTAGQAVTLVTQQNAVRNTQCIGGDGGDCMHAVNLATATSRQCTNNTGETQPPVGWVSGQTTCVGSTCSASRTVPSGTDRLLVAASCWERGPVLVPPAATPTFTGCAYGTRALTKIGEASVNSVPDASGSNYVTSALWYLKEADIAAASNTTLACTGNNTIDGGRPIILASGIYNNINQTTPTGNVQTAAVVEGTSISTAPLSSTTNPGIAIQTLCAGNNGGTTPDAGWDEKVDVCEDTACGTRIHVGDRSTAGETNIAGGATFTDIPGSSERLAMVVSTLAGSGTTFPDNPSEVVVRTQMASRCAFHDAPGWQVLQDTPCTVIPGHKLAVVAEYTVTDAAEANPVGKQLSCCWANCDDAESFFPVDDVGTNGVRYGSSGLTPHGTLIASRLLTGAACTHVNGAYITRDEVFPQALAPGQCSTFGYVLEVLPTINLATQNQLTCTLALDDNTLFAPGNRATILVKAGVAASQ